VALAEYERLMKRAEAQFHAMDERADQRLEESKRHWDRRLEQSELYWREQLEESMRRSDEGATRIIARMAKDEQHFIEALAENSRELAILHQRSEDMRMSIQANTRAVLSVLDRLEPGTS